MLEKKRGGKRRGKNKRGQIWVETIIYTLIAFVMIGLVLYFATTRLGESKDKVLIDQSLSIMQEINSIIESDIRVPGNKRLIEITLKKGELKIDGVNDKIIFELESSHEYSEPGQDVPYGGITARTEKKGELNIVTLTGDYGGVYDLKYQGNDELKSLTQSPTPYNLFITNKGGDPIVTDFELG